MDDRRVTEAMFVELRFGNRLVDVLAADERHERHHLLDRDERVRLVRLAEEQLRLARSRYNEGVADNREIIEAQTQLAVAAAVYKQGDRERGLALGEQAIKLDSRYADLKFLKENLWGDRLLKDAQSLLETPRLKATLAQVQSQQDQFSPKSTQ